MFKLFIWEIFEQHAAVDDSDPLQIPGSRLEQHSGRGKLHTQQASSPASDGREQIAGHPDFCLGYSHYLLQHVVGTTGNGGRTFAVRFVVQLQKGIIV